MTEFIISSVLLPAFWVVALVLAFLCWCGLRLRLKIGRSFTALLYIGLWAVLTFISQLTYSNDFLDGRYWIHNALTVAAGIIPVLIFAVIVPRDSTRPWVIGGSAVSVALGALAIPLVAIYSVCALGIDCL